MSEFEQQRHRPPELLERPRELVVACAPLRSNVNLSRIVRTAGCCGVPVVVACGSPQVVGRIVRDALAEGDGEGVTVDVHRSLAPVLLRYRDRGYPLVGLEQASGAQQLFDYVFPRRAVLVVGNERVGIEPEILRLLDAVVEIPVYGQPFSLNVATAAAMALYEYCRQFPRG